MIYRTLSQTRPASLVIDGGSIDGAGQSGRGGIHLYTVSGEKVPLYFRL